jgi:membrane-bound serine protease (ClpP class)
MGRGNRIEQRRIKGQEMHMRFGSMIAKAFFGLLCVALGIISVGRAQRPDAQAVVVKLVLADTMQPMTQEIVARAIAHAESRGAQALVIELNTPGGLLDSTRAMVGAILSSRAPVIVYVSPSGARAGSAGFFLLEAADVAAMAPGTNAGAAHPVAGFGTMDETIAQKVTNDAEAFLRSYVARRNRNVEAATEAVRASRSYSADEALAGHLVDLTAASDAELVARLDGKTVARIDGSRMILHLAGARIEEFQPSLREKLLDWLMNPNIALLFLVGGALLIYLEFNVPGTIVPGALGAVMVLVSVFALNLLPVRFTAILLLIAAAVLLSLEAKMGGHGVLATAGILSLGFGLLTLVNAPIEQMRVNPWLAFAASTGFGAITVFLLRLALRARKSKFRLGAEALVGRCAVAMEPLAPEGHVLVEGEIWNAVAAQPLPKGAEVRVIACEQSRLRVEAEVAALR